MSYPCGISVFPYLFDWETFFNDLLQYILVEVPTSLEFQHLKDQHYLNDLKRFQSQHYLGQEPISTPISVIDTSANFTFFNVLCSCEEKIFSPVFDYTRGSGSWNS